MQTNRKRIYSAAEAREVLGVCAETFYKIIRKGDLRTFKEGSRRKVSDEAITEYIAKREQEG